MESGISITSTQKDSHLVLVVEDDRFMQIQLCYLMEEEGYQVVEASNGEEGLAAYTRLQPDIVLLDAMMPVMDGFTCCTQLRALSASSRIPVLMITALEDQESVDRAFEVGATDYITKPIHWAVLRQRVHRLLQSGRAMKELQQQTERVRLSEEQLSLALKAAHMGTWDWDIPSGKVAYSVTTEANFGFAPGSFDNTYKSFLRSVHPEDHELFTEAVRCAVEEGAGYDIQFRVIWPDGSVHWIASKGQVCYDKTGALAVRMTGINMEITKHKQAEEALLRARVAEAAKQALETEITERKRAEEEIRKALEKEKELSELKSRFVTMTSHEFRTPLSTILSSAEIIRKYSHKLSEEKKLQHLQQIQFAVKNMTQMLNDVLLIGKAEAGKLEFQPTSFELVQFCSALVEEMQISTDTHAITFVSQGECTNAWMDEKLLRHILSNLLSNAIKYSPHTGTVHFDLVCKQEKAIFQIQDEGIGIPAADQAQLFDAFHRASNVGTISGTGLGLAIVKKAVDLHGGKIAFNSKVGVGTTFMITIPLYNKT